MSGLEERVVGGPRADSGEMGSLIRAHDWAATPLGSMDGWPGSLRGALNLVLASPLPSSLTWGPQQTQLYNDAFRAILGQRHPRALGRTFEDCWRGAFPGTGLPLHNAGAAGVNTHQRLFLTRDGHLEELFFTYAITPVVDERGEVGGHLHQLVDVTAPALDARRLRALADLAEATADAATLEQCLGAAARALTQHQADLPLLLFYLIDEAGTAARLIAGTKLPPGSPGHPERQILTAAPPAGVWPLGAALAAGRPVAVNDVQARFAGLTAGPYPEPITSAFVLPVGNGPAGAKAVVVAGVSQRARMHPPHPAFYGLLAAGLGDAVARTTAAEDRRRREAPLAELDLHDPTDEAAMPGPRPRVLLANANNDMRDGLARLLGRLYQVRAVGDGEAALQEAQANPPDIIVLDVRPSRRDGFETLKALRAAEATRLIPVILLSARAGQDAALEALDAGAGDYLVEPFSGKALLARVRSTITLAKLRKQAADKLAEAERELEAFSYSVSHDLRTPLRAIDGFSRALLAEQGAKLDEQGRRYLERIRAATQRMAELIDDLLSLSRITRGRLARERVDLSAIARRVLADLAARDPERNVEAAVAEGLVAEADPRLITALFQDLLGNAWKFSSKLPQARIQVASETRPDGPVFVVRDNGAGFNMEYAKKLFQPFQRLHSASEFPGRGIGLATVHRIVSRHGGRIWAQSAPDQGATFYFTLGEPA